MRQTFLVAVGLGLLFSAGCGKQVPAPVDPSTAATPRAAVRLTLLVVDDPELASAAKLLRGEWAERSGGELVVEEMTLDELIAAQQMSADLVVYPSEQLGTLVGREWLRPVRESVLKDSLFAFDDLFSLVRNQVMRYGGQVFSVSLGEAPLVLAWQGNEASKTDTWVRLDRYPLSDAGDQQFVQELIARAASHVDTRNRAELLFDPQTLAPRLSSPPLERALEEMVIRSRMRKDVEARAQITTATVKSLAGDKPWQFARLPRAEKVFDVLRQQWQPKTDDEPLTVLGFAGRSVSVTSGSRNATSAFKLLAWLTSGETAMQLSSRSHSTVWSRSSQSLRADRWLQDRGGKEAATLITRMLSSENYFLLPRVPGIDRYLVALNDAVGQAVRGEASPAEALKSAADEWNKISDSLGREQQLLAYRRHLGLVAISK